MRLVIFSDIHGNQYAMQAFLEDIGDLCYDGIIFCGDVFGYYYGQEQVLGQLFAMRDLVWLKGNHDSYAVSAWRGESNVSDLVQKYGHSYENMFRFMDEPLVRKLDSLPERREIYAGEKRIGIFHGTPDDPLEGRLYPRDSVCDSSAYEPYDIVIMGHTHHRMIRRCGHTLLINPGSLGQQRDGRGCGYLLLDTEAEAWEFRNVAFSKDALYNEIDRYDPHMSKLKETLERKNPSCEES